MNIKKGQGGVGGGGRTLKMNKMKKHRNMETKHIKKWQ
jgi:hypothetical protein